MKKERRRDERGSFLPSVPLNPSFPGDPGIPSIPASPSFPTNERGGREKDSEREREER